VAEILAIPEWALADVIKVIRAGLAVDPKVAPAVFAQLTAWCAQEERWLAARQC